MPYYSSHEAIMIPQQGTAPHNVRRNVFAPRSRRILRTSALISIHSAATNAALQARPAQQAHKKKWRCDGKLPMVAYPGNSLFAFSAHCYNAHLR